MRCFTLEKSVIFEIFNFKHPMHSQWQWPFKERKIECRLNDMLSYPEQDSIPRPCGWESRALPTEPAGLRWNSTMSGPWTWWAIPPEQSKALGSWTLLQTVICSFLSQSRWLSPKSSRLWTTRSWVQTLLLVT